MVQTPVGEEVDINNVESIADSLQETFEDVIVKITEAIEGVDVKNLRARISCFFNRKKESTLAIEDYLTKLESFEKPEGVLNYLVRSEFIGWLNYELIKVFQKVANNKQLDDEINQYEESHLRFLQVKFSAVIPLFQKRPDLAPTFPIGLPKLEIHLDAPWQDKTIFEWKEFLQKRFTWPPHLIIRKISKKCIVLTYAILPFFVSSVIRDLNDPHVLTELESEGIKVHFLFNFGSQDVASQTISTSVESYEISKSLSTQHINSDCNEEVGTYILIICDFMYIHVHLCMYQKIDAVSQTTSMSVETSEISRLVSTPQKHDVASQTTSIPIETIEVYFYL